jgi:sugar/nucleoside kinase (ribokinase family)
VGTLPGPFGRSMIDPSASPPPPVVVVVGAAARDIAADDPRGWRLGGGVSYSALTTARLGIPTGAIVGVDEEASRAAELDLLREAGVAVHLVPLDHGPVFVNLERAEGRHQLAVSPSDGIPVVAVPDDWRGARGWILAPVAAELPADWAAVPSEASFVAVGWQGLLRELVAGEPVRHLEPGPDALVARADLVGLSRDDVDSSTELAALCRLLRPGATLAVTQGDRGGLVLEAGPDGPGHPRHYPPVRSHAPIDPTGAGDVFLAALAAARIEPRLVGGRIGAGFDLLLAAAAASLVLEGPGMLGVPDRGAVIERIAAARREGTVEPV